MVADDRGSIKMNEKIVTELCGSNGKGDSESNGKNGNLHVTILQGCSNI